MITLDGTDNKSELGANAILGVSMAVARAGAKTEGKPLYTYLARSEDELLMPVADDECHQWRRARAGTRSISRNSCWVPHGAGSFAEALRMGAETYHVLRGLLHEKGYNTGVGDEGGFAPSLDSNEAGCAFIVDAIEAAGYKPGRDISIALDPASSTFWTAKGYNLAKSGLGLKSADEMTALYESWIDKFPIVLIEDGLGKGTGNTSLPTPPDWADGYRSSAMTSS